MIELNGNMILIGDTHFGKRKFSIDFLENQLAVFEKQIFPYMEENKIDKIMQFGDLFDNRTTANIIWFEKVKSNFFDKLKELNITMYTFLGNHDIAYRESRDISLTETISQLYPDNVKLFKNRETISLNNEKILIVPWITKNESLTTEEIKDVDYVFGHFEIRNFEMTKGHKDMNAKLTPEFFENGLNIKGVYSGHFHLKRNQGVIEYLGTPFQMDWGDYNEEKGFYNFDGITNEFIENTSSKKFIKVKYNDEENTDRNIEVKGLFKHSKLFTDEEFEELLPHLQNQEVKTFINKHQDNHYEELLEKMKKADIKGSIVNNQELSAMIGTEYILDNATDISQKDTKTLIIETLESAKPELIPLLNELFTEIQTEMKEEL